MLKPLKLPYYSLFFLLFCSCKIADISIPNNLPLQHSEQLALQKLDAVIEAQGFAQLEVAQTYQCIVTDHWPGLIGGLVKLWPDKTARLAFKFSYGTFDGQATFQGGKRAGDIIGLQAWHYYEKLQEETKFQLLPQEKKAKKLAFGLAALHYFIELPYRLRNAEVHRDYGTEVIRGINYDRVFASWKAETPQADYDQYILYINPSTQLVDYCLFTLRDNKSPFTRNKYGSIAYLDYENVNGFMVPTRMPVMIDNKILRAKSFDKYFHQFTVEAFELGLFPTTELSPFSNLDKLMDVKPE